MSTIVISPIPLIPCPYCKAPGEMFTHHKGGYAIECSDLASCPQWPLTDPHPTPEAAAQAWNDHKTH